eukprot:TRINITY_DN78286_c0_g1_i1.p1 TRINITY_DN78286_c0_g1~~TRINITY_DN78286_c0_g1_i1.p1  ORF type:complete len:508 (+),score=109.51 TRINITY_DN78286_c0_g1_i1:104-1627(+)
MLASPELCHAPALAAYDCAEEEQGISWAGFLRMLCQYCQVFGTCEPAVALVEALTRIWMLIQDELAGGPALACKNGALAAAIVHAQFFRAGLSIHGTPLWQNLSLPKWMLAALEPPEEMPDATEERQDWQQFSRPLLPFPLLASQHDLYSRLDPISPMTLCSEQDGKQFFSRRVLPRAEAARARCAVRRSDSQLLETCRSRRNAGGDLFKDQWGVEEIRQLRWQSRAAAAFQEAVEVLAKEEANSSTCQHAGSCTFTSPLQAANSDLRLRREVFWELSCPAVPDSDDAKAVSGHTNGRDMEKYKHRTAGGGCQSERGLWGTSWQDSQKCVVLVVAELLGFRPGQLLLDWGSGCGHTLSWAKAYYDVDGLGIEATASAVTWASHFSLGKHCAIDGRKMGWIPDGMFDHVFSYAALTHLEVQEQCQVARQLVRKLRPGGKAFLGWNRAQRVSPWIWHDCFGRYPGGRTWDVENLEVIEEWRLFPEDKSFALDNFLWQFPTYSVLLTRAH